MRREGVKERCHNTEEVPEGRVGMEEEEAEALMLPHEGNREEQCVWLHPHLSRLILKMLLMWKLQPFMQGLCKDRHSEW